MECTNCGAEIEADSRFCVRCATPVEGAAERDEDGDRDDGRRDGADRVDRSAREAAAPASPSAQGVKWIGVVLGLATLVLGIVRLSNRPSVQFEVIEPPDFTYGTGSTAEAGPVIPRDEPPERPPTESERALAGTWVATVGFEAPRPASTGSMLVQMQALQTGLSEPMQRCMWIELYENLRGFQHECGVVGGEPSALERTDPLTGRTSPLGVAIRWSFDGGRLSITYDEDMIVTAGGRPVRFRQTALALPQGSPPFDVQQSFPEHADVPPLSPRFDVFAGSYLGDEPRGE